MFQNRKLIKTFKDNVLSPKISRNIEKTLKFNTETSKVHSSPPQNKDSTFKFSNKAKKMSLKHQQSFESNDEL